MSETVMTKGRKKDYEEIDDLVRTLVDLYDDTRIREVVARARIIDFDRGYDAGYKAGYESGQASE